MQQQADNTTTAFKAHQYNKYTSLYPFNDPLAFQEWRHINETSEAGFRALFEHGEQTLSAQAQSWLKHGLNPTQKSAAKLQFQHSNPLCHAIDFILDKVRVELVKACQDLFANGHPCVDPDAYLNIVLTELTAQLREMITPTLTLELNVARVGQQLQGDNSEQRFAHFIDMLKDPDYLQRLFAEYPVLLEQLVEHAQQSINQHVEFLCRLTQDHRLLCQKFGQTGQLLGFGDQSGDAHNQGRTVRVCHFEQLTLVYKPRSLQVDASFSGLLQDLNRACGTDLKSPECLNCDTHGWTEFITRAAATDTAAIAHYHRRMGHYLALLYVMNSGDFHHENIIGQGAHPILVDLESLFHVTFRNNTQQRCDDPSLALNFHTVLDAMLLPQKTMFAGQSKGIDVSALGYQARQQIELPMGQLKNMCRDDMHFAADVIETRDPVPNPQSTDPEATEQLISGFDELYAFFSSDPQWLTENRFFRQLSTQKYRCILRPTDTYHQLIQCSRHPDNLRDQTERDLFIDEKLWVMTQSMGHLKRVIRYEADCIKSGNIPIFHFSPLSRDLHTGDGQVISDFFHHPAGRRIRHTLAHLSASDRAAQQWLIRATMHTHQPVTQAAPIDVPCPADADQLCHQITEQLLGCAHQSRGVLHWKNVDLLNDEQRTINSKKEYELFGGNLGSLLYLHAYGQVFNHQEVLNQVHQTAEYLANKLPQLRFDYLGGFVGMGGVLYVLSHIQKSTGSRVLLDGLQRFTQHMINQVSHDQSFDVMHGAAGCLLAALAAHRLNPRIGSLELADACASHLADHFTPQAHGGGWTNPIAQDQVLGGFSHGVTGIVFALACYDQLAPHHKHTPLITQGMMFENRLFDPQTANFQDLREQDSCCEGMFAWCNGGLGIAMARLAMPAQTPATEQPHDRWQQKAIDALGHNQSLCHGDASVLAYLHMLAMRSDMAFSQQQLNELVHQVLSQVSRSGLTNGVPFHVFDPGLMVGSVGLAYQMLRIKNPQRVPDVLLLQ